MNERLAWTTAASCAAIAVLFAIWKRDLAGPLGVIGGGVLIGLSWWAIRSAVDGLIRVRSEGETGRKTTGFSLVKFFTRHAIVALAAYGMMVRLHVDPMGLLAGVSSLGVALAVEVLRDLRWRRFQ
jgi:small-conductance mechanosensitive channel